MDASFEQLRIYIERGWPIFPCRKGDKDPLTPHGFKDAVTDEATIRAWLKRYPGCNWGMATGKVTGVWVVDIDDFDTWEMIQAEPFETATVETPRGGRHYWFRYPEDVTIASGAGKLGPGVDIRGDGGYVIVPPSATQKPYTFSISPE